MLRRRFQIASFASNHVYVQDSEIGKVILTVSTFDPDTGVGGINSFMLEVYPIHITIIPPVSNHAFMQDDFKGTFRIRNGSCFDSHCTAEIILNSKLNYDLKNVYTLTIVAFVSPWRISSAEISKHHALSQ